MTADELDTLINDSSNQALSWFEVLNQPTVQDQIALSQASTGQAVANAQAQAAIYAAQHPVTTAAQNTLGSLAPLLVIGVIGLAVVLLMK